MLNGANILIEYPYRIFFNESGKRVVIIKGLEKIQDNDSNRYKIIATICEIRESVSRFV